MNKKKVTHIWIPMAAVLLAASLFLPVEFLLVLGTIVVLALVFQD